MPGLRTAAMLVIAVASWLFVAAASAQEPHAHDEAGAHTHAAGDAADAGHDPAAEAAHDPAAEHGGEHGPAGLADDLPLWGIVAFIGFLFAVKKLGWGSFTSGMAGREAEEQRLIDEAEELRRQAADRLRTHRGQMEALDEHVRAVIAEANRDADHTRSEIRAVADREASNARARVDLEISRVKDQTLSELFEHFTQRVIDATPQKLSGGMGPAEQDKLIDDALAGFAAGQQQRV
ncbi:MAG: ATP synthase F0 subunit B [Planctomycetaceae bacterium]|nr:ATP synthase F0 subunit B [Planctomycetaceae bacterium]